MAGHLATAGFVAAGVGAAVGLTLLLTAERRERTKVGLVIGPGFVGVKGEL
ncbi:MAG: hypothetical protein R3F14_27730 [Polyangiaceae bacterium]